MTAAPKSPRKPKEKVTRGLVRVELVMDLDGKEVYTVFTRTQREANKLLNLVSFAACEVRTGKGCKGGSR